MRLALKLATGAGKTTVMAMIIAWQTINAVRRPGSTKFTRGFLVVTPGITIRDRLRVLHLTKHLIYTKWRDAGDAPKLHLFGQLKRIAKQWLDDYLKCKGGTYRREDAKEKKMTMDTYWVPGVNHNGQYGRWAFAEFTDAYQIQAEFKADSEYLYDKPYDDKRTVRVAGPFTVESLSPHRVLAVDENDELIDRAKSKGDDPQSFIQMIMENLKSAGVQ